MNTPPQRSSVFDTMAALPDANLTSKALTLIGFGGRYARVHDRLQLLLRLADLPGWSQKHHRQVVPLCGLIAEQYPLIIFHGDVGTGKSATAEGIANQLVAEAGGAAQDSTLYKLSNRVRGSGKVGEMGTLITQAFQEVIASAGKNRRAMLIIDEGDSLAADRSQEQSHHEDKVAVNTLIQHIDDLRKYQGRIVVFLCTNRLSILDAALVRRAAIVEEFTRPSEAERRQLLQQDLAGLGFDDRAFAALTEATAQRDGLPPWTYSDIRTRLYPSALSKAFPSTAVTLRHFLEAAQEIVPSPVIKNA
jgi:SpoVK/Ycf46/Vps4 family AAA+-type ATPase